MAKKVLIIDDDPEFTGAVTALLETAGYEVASASNGEAGFERAKKAPPNIILLDVMMTHRTEGFDISRSLKGDAATRDVPVVIVSGIKKEMNLPFGFEPDGQWLPVKAVLEKPVKPDVLLKTVEEYIS